MSFIKSTLFITILLSICTPAASYANETDELNNMMSVFNSSCPSNGQWTQAALGYTNQIVGILRQIQTDPDCTSLSGSLSDMQLMSTLFASVTSDPNEAEISSLQSEQKELLVMIAQSTAGSSNNSDLLTQLQAVNVQLATDQGQATYNNAYQNLRRQGQSLSFLVDGTKNLLHQADANEDCIKKNKSLLPVLLVKFANSLVESLPRHSVVF